MSVAAHYARLSTRAEGLGLYYWVGRSISDISEECSNILLTTPFPREMLDIFLYDMYKTNLRLKSVSCRNRRRHGLGACHEKFCRLCNPE